MALSDPELREQELAQLRRLAQSPGWELLEARLVQCSKRNEQGRASLLRSGDTSNKTVYYQGVIDGLAMVKSELQASMAELAPKEESPLY